MSQNISPWRVGETVPWTVSWTGEDHFNIQISQDFPGLVDIVQSSNPGAGLPKFAGLHVTRLRLGIKNHLCHVCGQPTPKRDRYIFPKESGGFVTLSDDSVRYAGNVPPLHLACANRAQQQCPHLSQSYAVALSMPSEPTRLMPRTDVVEGMEKLALSMPPNLKLVYSCYRLYGPRFSAQVQKLRA